MMDVQTRKTETKTFAHSNSNDSLLSYTTPNGSDSEDKISDSKEETREIKKSQAEKYKKNNIESMLAELDDLAKGIVKIEKEESYTKHKTTASQSKENPTKKSEGTASNYEEEFVDISKIIVGKVFPDDKEDVFKDLKFTSQGASSEPALRIDCNNGEALLIINKKYIILQKPTGTMFKYRKTKQAEAEEMEKAVNKIMPYSR